MKSLLHKVKLENARRWTWFFGGAAVFAASFSLTVIAQSQEVPAEADGVMYALGKDNATVALDAVTGKEIWVRDNGQPRGITNRGFNYWESKDRSDRRLLYAVNNRLQAVDARTGKLVILFGDQGSVDLREARPKNYPLHSFRRPRACV